MGLQAYKFKSKISQIKWVCWKELQTVQKALPKSLQTGDEPQMTLLMLRTAPLNDGLPASTTKLISRTLRKLVAQLETTEVESSPKRYDSKSICTGKVPKPLRESESDICISDTLKNN